MRRHLAPEDKAHLVLRFIKSKESASALCRKHRISQSNYYRWRQIFVLAGTDALRRIPKCAIRAPARMPTKANEHRAKVNAEKIRLQRSIEAAVRSQSIDRRVRLTETTKRAIIDLVDTSSIPKITALTVARVARSTYYQWRKIMLMNVSPQENQYIAQSISGLQIANASRMQSSSCSTRRHWTTASIVQYGRSTTYRKVWPKRA